MQPREKIVEIGSKIFLLEVMIYLLCDFKRNHSVYSCCSVQFCFLELIYVNFFKDFDRRRVGLQFDQIEADLWIKERVISDGLEMLGNAASYLYGFNEDFKVEDGLFDAIAIKW